MVFDVCGFIRECVHVGGFEKHLLVDMQLTFRVSLTAHAAGK